MTEELLEGWAQVYRRICVLPDGSRVYQELRLPGKDDDKVFTLSSQREYQGFHFDRDEKTAKTLKGILGAADRALSGD